MRPSRLPPALLAAYRTARYEVTVRGIPHRLAVGAPLPPSVRSRLGHTRAAAFVTPAAPYGRPRSPDAERAVFRRFLRRLRRAGRRHLIGEGRSETAGCWQPERSALVALPDRAAAAAMGRALRQNAVLWVLGGGPVQLLALR